MKCKYFTTICDHPDRFQRLGDSPNIVRPTPSNCDTCPLKEPIDESKIQETEAQGTCRFFLD